MGNPIVGLKTAEGAGAGLADLLTQQLLLQKQAEIERTNRAHEALASQQIEATKAYHQSTVESHKADLADRNKDREEGRRISRVQISLARPIGSSITPEEYQHDTTDLGIPKSYYDEKPGEILDMQGDAPGDVTTGPSTIRYRGKEADLLKAEGIKAQGERADATNNQRELDRQTRLLIAEMSNATWRETSQAGKPQIRVMQIWDPATQQNRSVLMSVDPSTNQATEVFGGLSQLPGGMKLKQADLQSLDNQLGQILQAGEKTKWGGTGPLAGMAGSLIKQYTGKGSDKEDMLRAAIDSINAEVAHEKYGSAFTTSERGMLRSFSPNSRMAGSAIANKLRIMQYAIRNRLGEITQGKLPDRDATPLQQLLDEGSKQIPRAEGAGALTKPKVNDYTIEEVHQ